MFNAGNTLRVADSSNIEPWKLNIRRQEKPGGRERYNEFQAAQKPVSRRAALKTCPGSLPGDSHGPEFVCTRPALFLPGQRGINVLFLSFDQDQSAGVRFVIARVQPALFCSRRR
jgi:hypothetical protein